MTADRPLHKASELKNRGPTQRDALLPSSGQRGHTKKIISLKAGFACFMSIGDVYRMTGKFELTGKNYSESIKISGKLKDTTAAADAAVGAPVFQ